MIFIPKDKICVIYLCSIFYLGKRPSSDRSWIATGRIVRSTRFHALRFRNRSSLYLSNGVDPPSVHLSFLACHYPHFSCENWTDMPSHAHPALCCLDFPLRLAAKLHSGSAGVYCTPIYGVLFAISIIKSGSEHNPSLHLDAFFIGRSPSKWLQSGFI